LFGLKNDYISNLFDFKNVLILIFLEGTGYKNPVRTFQTRKREGTDPRRVRSRGGSWRRRLKRRIGPPHLVGKRSTPHTPPGS
jgi:hypothetical protein